MANARRSREAKDSDSVGNMDWDAFRATLNIDEARVAQLRDEMLRRARAYKLVELRKAYGMTQAQLAKLSGIDQPRISRIERGDLSRIEIATLQTLIAALGGRLELLLHVGDDIYRLPLSESWHRNRRSAGTTKVASTSPSRTTKNRRSASALQAPNSQPSRSAKRKTSASRPTPPSSARGKANVATERGRPTQKMRRG